MSETQPVKAKRLEQALKRFTLAAAAEDAQRQREKDDLAFQVPELQWDSDVRSSRAAQMVNGVPIPARPMLSIPKLDQPIQLVLNQEKAAHLGVQVHPLDADADEDTAEVIQGLYRRIEVDSRAGLARSWGFERAVKAGRGAYRVLTEYDPSGGHPSDQRLIIKRILHQGSVYLDPFAQEPDWSDGEWAFIVEDMPVAKFKRLYPDAELAAYDDGQLIAIGSEQPGWIGGDTEESRTIRVAEYFYVEYTTKTVKWGDGDNESREDTKRAVCWVKMTAIDELESGEWQGQYIPIIPVIGRELIPFDGSRRWVGIIGQNKDAQRLFNYAASGSVEQSALETKASHAIDPESIEGYKDFWDQKNIRNFPYLPYRRFIGSRDLGPPVPIQADMSKMQVNAMLLAQAADFLHAGTGAFEPSLGQNTPNVRTKGATLALQQQHDQGNSNWLDNLAEISMSYEAKVVLDAIPHVYDRPGRVVRILDLEDNPDTVMLNQPFTVNPQTQRPVSVSQPPVSAPNGVNPGMVPNQVGGGPSPVKHFDLNKGRYGVTVSIGKAYKSRVEAGQDQLGQLFQAEPQLFGILGDLYLKFADFPGHLEAAERMKKMLPPPLQEHKDGPDPAQQAQQLAGENQQLKALVQKAQQIIETKQVEQQAKITMTKIQESSALQGKVMDNATKLAVARIAAAKGALDAVREDEEERLALNQQQLHDADQADKDRAHEYAMAEQEHANTLQAASQAHQHAVDEAEQGGAIDSALASQGHDQALEQGDAATQGQIAVQAAAPQPDTGAGA